MKRTGFETVAILLACAASMALFQNCGSFQQVSLPLGPTTSDNSAGLALATANLKGFDIVMVDGGENAAGYGCGPVSVDTSNDGRIFMIDASGNVAMAAEPLSFGADNMGYGFAMAFAREYVQKLSADRGVILIPTSNLVHHIYEADDVSAYGGFTARPVTDSTSSWNGLLVRAQTALTFENKTNSIVAFLWQQGESDYQAMQASPNFATTIAGYEDRLKALFTLVQSTYGNGKQLPILVGEIGSYNTAAVSTDTTGQFLPQFNAALASVTSGVANSAVVAASDLAANSGSCDVSANASTHFSAASQLELGSRYYAKFATLAASTSSSITPVALATRMSGFGASSIAAGQEISCDYLNPDAIKNLSTTAIAYLGQASSGGATQSNGLAVVQVIAIARQAGFTGAVGAGALTTWQAQNPTANAIFLALAGDQSKTDAAAIIASGYHGVSICGGYTCFQAGACDNYGRRLASATPTPTPTPSPTPTATPHATPTPTATPVPIAPNFSTLETVVFRPNCVSCHSGFATYSGVMTKITAGNASASDLYNAIKTPGNIMPQNGAPLTAAEQTAIQTWINNGALNN